MSDTISQSAPAAPSSTPAPAAPAAPVRAVEVWAEKKGFLPQWKPQPPVQRNLGGQIMTIEQAPVGNPDFWKYAAARQLHGWAIGEELTEEDFDAAIDAATSLRVG